MTEVLSVSAEVVGDPTATGVSFSNSLKTLTVKHGDTGNNRPVYVTVTGIINPIATATTLTTESGDPLETEGGDPLET